jgi:hypothetical protein
MRSCVTSVFVTAVIIIIITIITISACIHYGADISDAQYSPPFYICDTTRRDASITDTLLCYYCNVLYMLNVGNICNIPSLKELIQN